jgi:uncharacterized protein (TIGR03067 family)
MSGFSLMLSATLLIAADPKDDLGKLQGTWNLVRVSRHGKDIPRPGGTWRIKGDALTIELVSDMRGTIRLDPKVPGRVEQTVEGFDAPLVAYHRIKGDELRLCFPVRGEPPAEVPDRPDPRFMISIFRRTAGDPGGGLQGTWKRVEVFLNGKRLADEDAGDYVLTVKGEEFVTRTRMMRHAAIKVDSTADPKWIEVTYTDSLMKGKTEANYYRLDGNRLTVAEAIRGEAPAFVDEKDTRRMIWIYERAATTAIIAADPKDDLGRFQGEWKQVQAWRDGREIPGIDVRMRIKGDALTKEVIGFDQGTIHLDPKVPGQIEWTNEGDESLLKETYRIVGDQLRICYTVRGEPPAEIPDRPDPRFIITVYRRTAGDPGGGLQGTWKMVELLFQGRRGADEDVGDHVLTVKGEEYVRRTRRIQHAVIKLDPTTDPKRFDYTYTDGLQKGFNRRNYYELEGNRLTVVEARRDEAPVSLKEKDRKGWFQVFERLQP